MKLRPALDLWPVLALCLVLSTRWMLADAWPGTVSTLSSQACAALLGGVAWLVLARRTRAAETLPGRRLASAFVAGALLFAGLNTGLVLPSLMPRSSDLMVGFSLTPIVIAVALVAVENAADGLSGRDLLPGLMVGAGLLLILPQPSLASFAGDAVLVLAPVSVGIAAVWLEGPAESPLTTKRMSAALLGAASVFGLLALRSPRSTPPIAATALDLLTLALTLLALERCGARRFGAQFAAVPFLLLLEGMLFTRLLPDWMQAGGLVLLLVAALLLLGRRRPLTDEQSVPLLT